MPGTTTTTYLDALNWGTGVAETTNTLGQDRLDVQIPPDQYQLSNLQITRMKNLLLAISQYWKGGARLQVVTQSSNPFAVGEYGFYVDTNGISYTVSNGVAYPSNPVGDAGVGSNIASASTIAPVAYITHITGVVTVQTITPPAGFSTRGGQLVLIPDAIWATNTSGNIALATTAVVSKALTMTYDPGTSKFYPSY